MSEFKTKMHQIRYLLSELTALPSPLALFKGPTSDGRGGRGGMGKGREER